MNEKGIKIGDIVTISLEACAVNGGYDCIDDMGGYFASIQADEFARNDGLFSVEGVSGSGTFEDGYKWEHLILKPITDDLTVNDFLGSNYDKELISNLGGDEVNYIIIEDFNLNIVE